MAREVRVWAGHAVFAAILVGSLAAQQLAAGPPADEGNLLEQGILRVAGAHGLELRRSVATGGVLGRAFEFDAPGCLQPIEVSARWWTLEDEPVMERAPESGSTRRYIYYDRSWEKPMRWAVTAQRIKFRALATFRLSDYPSSYLLVVDTPGACPEAEKIDWGAVWTRAA